MVSNNTKNAARQHFVAHGLKIVLYVPLFLIMCGIVIFVLERCRATLFLWNKRALFPPQSATRIDLRIGSTSEESSSAIIAELYSTVTKDRLMRIADDHKARYADAPPLPHISIDGIFPGRILQAVVKETDESTIRGVCMPSNGFKPEQTIMDERQMGFYTRILFAFMKSSPILLFLQELTGITGIIPHPHYGDSGLHFTSQGSHLDIHAGVNRHTKYELNRRISVFIFLNPDCRDDYGGHFELWSQDLKSCHQKILPTLGRIVVFSSTDFSYHDRPQETIAPDERVRRSMALFYYTNGWTDDECSGGSCSGGSNSTFVSAAGRYKKNESSV